MSVQRPKSRVQKRLEQEKQDSEKESRRQARAMESGNGSGSGSGSEQAQDEPADAADAADEEIGRGSVESEKSTAETEKSVVKFGIVQVSEADSDFIQKLVKSGPWADDEPEWTYMVLEPAGMKPPCSSTWVKLVRVYARSEEHRSLVYAVTQMQLEALRQMYAEIEHRVKEQQWLFFRMARDEHLQLVKVLDAIEAVHGLVVSAKLLESIERRCDHVTEECKKLALGRKTVDDERLKQKASHDLECKKLSREKHLKGMEASNAAALQQERAAVAATCTEEIKATVAAYLGQHFGDVLTQTRQTDANAMTEGFASSVAAGVKQFIGSAEHLAIITPSVDSTVRAALKGEDVIGSLRDTVNADVMQFMGTEAYLAIIRPVGSDALAAALRVEKKEVVGDTDVTLRKLWYKHPEPRVDVEEKVFDLRKAASATPDVDSLLQGMEQTSEAKYEARLKEETTMVETQLRAEFGRQQTSGGSSGAGFGQRGAYQNFGFRGHYNDHGRYNWVASGH
ncbi:hypothetical protein LTS10_009078 [Elasticomyces elasticus]|nr:hypothetical protein LTS10_009078 [Elasticomyces elasticus]